MSPAAAQADTYKAVFGAMAHAARRQIMLTLNFAAGVMTAGEIAAMFQHAWPTTTRHLQVLEAAGLIVHERRGRTRVYRLARHRLAVARDFLSLFVKDPG